MRNTRHALLAILGLAFVLMGAASIPPAKIFTTAQFNYPTPIQHIVVIVQENRSYCNLLGFTLGETDCLTYTDPQGNTWPNSPVGLNSPFPTTAPSEPPNMYDLNHQNADFVRDCNNGHTLTTCPMNGWANSNGDCVNSNGSCALQCPTPAALNPSPVATPGGNGLCAVGYVPAAQASPYLEMAANYASSNTTFQDNQGGSFPAHIYLLAGSSSLTTGSTFAILDNGASGEGGGGNMGCDAPAGTVVPGVEVNTGATPDASPFPCTAEASILDTLENAGRSWTHYNVFTNNPLWDNLWTSPDAFALHGCQNGTTVSFCPPKFLQNVATGPSRFISDVGTCGRLANVTWVTPTAKTSDHGGINDGSGPEWVQSAVNAVGNSCYWKNTAIIVTWDDWGGWYDPVPPPGMPNFMQYGPRVPLIVISPYTSAGYVSHVTHLAFGSTLHFIESTFNLPSLGNTDARADNLSDFFNFNLAPKAFNPIAFNPDFDQKRFIAKMRNDKGVVDAQ